jgi:hypothetical protein
MFLLFIPVAFAMEDSTKSLSATINSKEILNAFGECRFEYALHPKWSIGSITGFGKDSTGFQFDLGIQQRYYLLGDFSGGISIGSQLIYWKINHKTTSDDVQGHLFYPSIYGAAKYIFDIGFTLDAQIGLSYTTAIISDQQNSEQIFTSNWDRIALLNLGWSF